MKKKNSSVSPDKKEKSKEVVRNRKNSKSSTIPPITTPTTSITSITSSKKGVKEGVSPIILVSPSIMEGEESKVEKRNSMEDEVQSPPTVPKLSLPESFQRPRSESGSSCSSMDLEAVNSKSNEEEEKEENNEKKEASSKDENLSNSAVPSYMRPLQRKNSGTRNNMKNPSLASPRGMKMGVPPATFGAPPSPNPKYGSLRAKNSVSMLSDPSVSVPNNVNSSPPAPSSPKTTRFLPPPFASASTNGNESPTLSSTPPKHSVSLGKKAGLLTASDMALLKLSNTNGPVNINPWANINAPNQPTAPGVSPRKQPSTSKIRTITVNTSSNMNTSSQNLGISGPASPKVRPVTPKVSTPRETIAVSLKQQVEESRERIIALIEELEKKERGITELNQLCAKLNGELSRNQEHNRQLEKHIVTICTLHLQRFNGKLPTSPTLESIEIPPLNQSSESIENEEREEESGEMSEEEIEGDVIESKDTKEESLEERVLKRERQFYQLKNRYIQTLSSIFPKIRQFEESLEAARDDAYRAHRAYEASQKEVAALKAELARLKR